MENSAKADINGKSQLFLSIPKNIIFPEELNRYLKEQMEILVHENGMLKRHLEEKENSLKEKCSTIEVLQTKFKENKNKYDESDNLKQKFQFTSAASLTSAKIVELSKKLREKNSEVESLKTKCSKLEKKLVEEMEKTKIDSHGTLPPIDLVPTKIEKDQMKKLQERLNTNLNRLRETQNSNIQLRNELKIANKYIQQEIGDSLENLNSNSNWRGRAQIICDLQEKNHELKEKLKKLQNGRTTEVSHNSDVRKHNEILKENVELKRNLDKCKHNIEVLKARCKVLENEQVNGKSRTATLISQIDKDQALLKTLTNQVTNQQNFTNETIKQKDKHIKYLQQDNEILRIELSKHKATIENLTKNLNDKIEEVKDLMQNKRKSPRPISSYGYKNKNNSLDDKLINRLECERKRLMELTEVQAKRLETERDNHAKTQNQLRLEQKKCAKLETNVARLEIETFNNSIHSTGSYSANLTNRSIDLNDVKNELELAQETIKALKMRLEIEQHERKVDLKKFAEIIDTRDEKSYSV